MTRPAKPATVRFYLDADVLGLAKVLSQLRPEFTYPGDPGAVVRKKARSACPITSPAVLDPIWIPQVTALGWLIVTRDHNIALNRAEINAVRNSGARMVALAGRDAVGTWDQLEVFMRQWRAIEGLLDQPGPFIYSATRSTLRPVSLD